MQFRLSTLLKLVVASALVMGFWRLTGVAGLTCVLILGLMIVLPSVLIHIGRKLGDPILSGVFSGGIGFACWHLAWSFVVPRRMPFGYLLLLVLIGLIWGGIFGLIISFSDAVRFRPRPKSRWLALRYDLVLALFLVATIAGVEVVDQIRWVILPDLLGY